jgi:hypothetical protein
MATRKTTTKAQAPIYQLKVTLKGTKPPIWRRVQVTGDTKLSRLHEILQAAMGWENYHLHEFRMGREGRIGIRDPEWDAPGEVMDERRVALSSVAPEARDKFTYAYDFGDDWEHTVLVEKILAPAPNTVVPSCIAGKRACPPEDCGGVWGYAELLNILADPEDPEREERLEWLGGEWDAEAFDLEDVNRRLAPLRKG